MAASPPRTSLSKRSERDEEDHDSEETLPLYNASSSETHQPLSLSGSTKPPDPRATPAEVRDFLVHLLTSSRGLQLDHARRVAARWTMGTGRELRAYPPLMYRDIFDFEDGWIVYKEVKMCFYSEEERQAGFQRWWRTKGKCEWFPPLELVIVHGEPMDSGNKTPSD